MRTSKFFPTIAEIREKAEPFLQEFNLKNRLQLADNALGKCKGNVWWDERQNPHCRIEEDTPEQCKLAGDGMCGKWDPKHRDTTRKDVYGDEPEREPKP